LNMKILFVTARFPYPPEKGDKAIPYYRLKYLSQTHEITLLTFYETKKELRHMDKIKPYCKEMVAIKKSILKSLFNMLVFGFFSKFPFQVLYYRYGTFRKELLRLLAAGDFDILHVYMLRIAGYGEDVQLPKIVELIDSMQLNFQRRMQLETFPKNLFFRLELARLIPYENRLVKKYHRAIVVSKKDRDYIGHENVVDISLGVNTDEFKKKGDLADNKTIVFTGNMGYFPNKNALLWFLKKCFDLIRQKVPDVRLIIAGKNPGAKIKRYDDGEAVRVLGYVDSIADVLNTARVAVAPMQAGSGMQFKILEAMACGLPVVTTSIGLGAIPAKNKKTALIADEPGDFANCCITLLNDYSVANSIGQKSMQMVRKMFSWEKNISSLIRLYQEVLREYHEEQIG